MTYEAWSVDDEECGAELAGTGQPNYSLLDSLLTSHTLASSTRLRTRHSTAVASYRSLIHTSQDGNSGVNLNRPSDAEAPPPGESRQSRHKHAAGALFCGLWSAAVGVRMASATCVAREEKARGSDGSMA